MLVIRVIFLRIAGTAMGSCREGKGSATIQILVQTRCCRCLKTVVHLRRIQECEIVKISASRIIGIEVKGDFISRRIRVLAQADDQGRLAGFFQSVGTDVLMPTGILVRLRCLIRAEGN